MKAVVLALVTVPLIGSLSPVASPTPRAEPPPPGPGPVHTHRFPVDPDAADLDVDEPGARRTERLPAGPPTAGQLCPAAAPKPVPNGRPIVVSLPPAKPFTVGTIGGAQWRNPPVADPSWRLGWYSFRWLTPLARRAVADRQTTSVSVLLGQVLRFYREYPDPGRAIPGWDEGISLRRLQSLSCLYSLTKDKRLVHPMGVEANVLFGPRYAGPPARPVHNHGLMANLRLIDAGTLLGRRDWVTRATSRMRAEAGLAFTRRGTSIEQSSAYHQVNTTMWTTAADVLQGIQPKGRNDPTVLTIRDIVARARNVTQWLTEPDGHLVQIGDAAYVRGTPAPNRTTAGAFRDDVAGLVVGRWSWKDPATSYYTIRYGPPRYAHGHPDKGAVTWTTAGARVLVGSGYFGYDTSNRYVRWQQSPASSNVAFPVGAAMRRTSMSMAGMKLRATRHGWHLTSKVYARAHARAVDVDRPGRTLTVSDTFRGRGTADQLWHLDPAWTLVSAPRNATVARFRHPRGLRLEVRTTARLASAVRGGTNPVAGWNFPKAGSRTAAWELRIRWTSGTARTSFRVS